MASTAERIRGYMAAHKQEMIEFLRDLVSIPSTTYHEEQAVLWLKNKLTAYGYDEVSIDPAGNCLAAIGRGKTKVLCDAHIDTVEPGTEEAWGFNPLEMKIFNGTLSGRGVVDDKGSIAALVFAGRALRDLGLENEVTFLLSASVAEEDVEGSCVRAMMEHAGTLPDAVIVAEPSNMMVVRGHKGRALIKIEVLGKAAHASAAHHGENALIKSLPVIQAIDSWRDFREDPFLGKGSIEVTKAVCDTPSLNTIPGKVTVYADRRISCGESKQQLLDELAPLTGSTGAVASIDIEEITTYTGHRIVQENYFPSWVMDEDHPLIASALEARRDITGKDSHAVRWDFCTNATYLCGIAGIPSVGFGPGDPALCHGSAEVLAIDDLVCASAVFAQAALIFGRKMG